MLRTIVRYMKRHSKEVKIPITQLVNENNLLKNKVALITGGSGGIGFAIAKSFIESGAFVIITGTNEEKLKKCCSDLGDKAEYLILDLKKFNSIESNIQYAIKKYGKIDILVNSAGIHSTNPIQDFFHVTPEEYDSIMEINLKGTYFVSQYVSKHMIDKNIKGHILNISSSTALEPAWSPYRLSKWGIKGFTLGLADQLLPYGIIVNGIAPGSTATNLLDYKKGDSIFTRDNPMKRYVMPEEVAQYAKLLVSDLGNMVVGETLYISGGRGNIVIPTFSQD